MWAYAAKVAIEYTTEQNNFQCGDSPGDWVRSGHSVVMGAMRDCMRNKGEADCEVGILNLCRSRYISTIAVNGQRISAKFHNAREGSYLLKVPTNAFTFKNLLRHYVKRVLTPL